MGMKSSERQGVCRAWSISTHALGGVLGALGAHFASFFVFVFYIDFSSIFFGFWRGFGRVLGGQNGPKIEIFGIFSDMLVETLFLVEFHEISDQIDG